MTLEKMNEHARLRRELEQAVNLKAFLEEAVGLRAQAMTGMPHASGYGDKLGELIPVIADASDEIDMRIDNLRKRIARQEADIIAFIDTIPDIQTRTIYRLRFLGGFTWTWIAVAIGGGNTADAVKKRCYRYLER